MIISRTPLRLSIGGGGTDLPFYYRQEEGSLVTATMNKYVYCVVKERFEEEIRLSYSENEEVCSLENLENDRAKEVLKISGLEKNKEIVTMADAPAGSGLGSSGAFTLGLHNAAQSYKGEKLSDKELAENAFDIEHNRLNYHCGKQDQYAAAFGGIFELKIDKEGNTSVRPLDISQETIDELEKNIQLFYTGQLRDSDEILEAQKKQVVSKERKMEKMRQIKSIGEDIKEALESDNPDKFGKLLHEHWSTKKKFTEKMTNPAIDDAYTKAREAGALGGKIMGAGGGGFFMFYVNQERENFREKMEDIGLRYMDFKFDWEGSKVIYDEK